MDTIKVPKQFESLFQKAQKYVNEYFKSLKQLPNKDTIEIANERYILVRAVSMSVNFLNAIQQLYKRAKRKNGIGMQEILVYIK